MNILADVHMYPPLHNAGAEWMLHAMFRSFTELGHSCTVLCKGGPKEKELHFQGIKILTHYDIETYLKEWMLSDLCFTHLDQTVMATNISCQMEKKLAVIVHNHWQLDYTPRAALVVFNSDHIRRSEHHAHGTKRSENWIVVRPPVISTDYKTERTSDVQFVTCINLSHLKGGHIFFRLARLRPDLKFLAVRGAYDVQQVPEDVPSNVTVIPSHPDIRTVFAKTKVLMCLSSYESYGRVAAEACASGIPVISSPTLGLVECLGSAGNYVQRDDEAAILTALDRLMNNPDWYKKRSALAFDRARYLDQRTDEELQSLATRIESL